MLLDHDSVDGLRILEGEEAETTRTTCGAISHNGALENFAELREVLL